MNLDVLSEHLQYTSPIICQSWLVFMCHVPVLHVPFSSNLNYCVTQFWKIKFCNYLCDRGEPSHDNSLCVIREDVDDLYEWQTFRPSSLHQHQISHALPEEDLIESQNIGDSAPMSIPA